MPVSAAARRARPAGHDHHNGRVRFQPRAQVTHDPRGMLIMSRSVSPGVTFSNSSISSRCAAGACPIGNSASVHHASRLLRHFLLR